MSFLGDAQRNSKPALSGRQFENTGELIQGNGTILVVDDGEMVLRIGVKQF
jgi:hypothetical protein